MKHELMWRSAYYVDHQSAAEQNAVLLQSDFEKATPTYMSVGLEWKSMAWQRESSEPKNSFFQDRTAETEYPTAVASLRLA